VRKLLRYSGYGLGIHSELELPDLPPGGEHADVVIRFGRVPPVAGKATLREEIALNTLAGAFHIKDGREIVLDPLPGVDPDVLRVVLMGRMMAFLLRQRGWLPLHASGIAIESQAVLFVGSSGSGKSTTAAAFHAFGHQVITDDVGAVRVMEQRCLVRGAGSRIRLLGDSRTVFGSVEPKGVFQWDKHTFDLAQGNMREPLPVRCIYLLEYGDKLLVEVIPPLSAVAALSGNCFVKRWRMDKAALSAHLSDCSAVAGAVRVCRLLRPRSLDALPELVRFIEREGLACG
jgi:hypothetical protein